MTYQRAIRGTAAKRELFARHAAPEAIDAALARAREAQRQAAVEVRWLENLRLERAAQIRAGHWPVVAEPAPTELVP